MKKLSEMYKELGMAFKFPIEIKDDNGHLIYYEDSDGYRERWELDANGNPTYCEDNTLRNSISNLHKEWLDQLSISHTPEWWDKEDWNRLDSALNKALSLADKLEKENAELRKDRLNKETTRTAL